MALISLQNASVVVGGNDLSDHCSGVEFSVDVDELDSTVMGNNGFKSTLGGLKEGSLKISLKQDFAASNIDSILWPLLGTVVTFVIKPVAAAVSTSNPSYSGSVLVGSYAPINGSVGDLVEFDLDWKTSGVVTRATA